MKKRTLKLRMRVTRTTTTFESFDNVEETSLENEPCAALIAKVEAFAAMYEITEAYAERVLLGLMKEPE